MVSLPKIAAIATTLGVLGSGALYLSSVVVLKDAYAQDQLEQMARSDGFELRHVKEEITYLKRERRDVRKVLFNYPDDEDALEELDEIEQELEDFEARKCFLMERNGMTCKERTD